MEPTIETTPKTDPVMEDREDASEAVENTGLPSDERDARESPTDSKEKASKDDPKDDESVATEPKEKRADFLSTVKEEPSKEAEEMVAEEATSHLGSVVHQKCTPSMDEDLTMDASATTHESGYHTPANSSTICGCFAF